MLKHFILLFCAFWTLGLSAQSADWVDQMNDPDANFYTIKQTFEAYWEGREVEKGKGYKQFMRWAEFWEPRVAPEGVFPDKRILMQQYQNLQQNGHDENFGLWQPKGPYNGSTLGSTTGIGRVNRVIFHPANHQIVFACTPAGGLWKSSDGGISWETNTDLLSNLGVSDLAINPLNPEVMYLATGDRDAGNTYSYGILKTTDGGATWKPTGLSFGIAFNIRAMNVYVSPADTNLVIAATSAGIYRSTDGGNSYTRVETGSYNNMLQKIGNPNILFSSTFQGTTCQIYRSTDAGVTWSVIADPVLPISNSRRIELAVTPDDTNYVYAVIGASNSGLEGVYRSTNGGNSWSKVDNGNVNLLGWDTQGQDQGGQAWYDLAIAVNPVNKNEIHVGGVNIWRSTNGGSNWNLAAHWYGGGGAPFVHADIHHLNYQPVTNHLYSGTDGGVYRDKPNQSAWDQLNDGMNITQYYRLSGDATDTNLILAGAQDNSTHRYNGSSWVSKIGGDGMDCAINPKSPNIMYGSSQYGNFRKSTNGGGNFNAQFDVSGVLPSGAWVTPIKLDPLHPDTLYLGYDRVYRSYNGGVNFNSVSSVGMLGGNADRLAIAPMHTNIIYVSRASNLWKSTDRGNTWTNLSFNTPGGNTITTIAIDYDNPDHVIITKSGYSSNNKVHESFDGGQSWNSISQGLPNVPANCVVIENNPEHSIYVGTDLGVFYRDSINPTWVEYNAGLPNLIVNDLEINYHNRKLRAATYGRGVWESPLYGDLIPPEAKANFPGVVCAGDTVKLLDNSDYSPNRFRWNIEPSGYTYVNGSTDTIASPELVFNNSGFYNISLTAENAIGKDSAYFTSAVVVGGLPVPYYSDLNQLDDYSDWDYEDQSPGWELVQTSKGMSFRANLFNNSSAGAEYFLTSPAINLTNHDSAQLSFDYAYSGSVNSAGDSLLVYAAGSCSNNWVLVQAFGEDGSGNFTTAAGSNSVFDPTASQWCGGALASCINLDLQAFSGQEGVRVRFVAVNAGANHLYLDNISLIAKSNIAPSVAFSSARQVCAMDSIPFDDQSYGSPDSYEWTFQGPVTLTSNKRNPVMLFQIDGLYDIKLKASNLNGSDSIIETGYLLVDPADSVAMQIMSAEDSICPGDDLAFSMVANNQGTNPAVTWYVNGKAVASGSDLTANLKNLKDGDVVSARLRSSLGCAYPDVNFSNGISVNTYPLITPQTNLPSLMCTTDTPLVLFGTPAGGTFTGNGVVNGSFDPALAGRGSTAITYTVIAASGCAFSAISYIGVTTPIPLGVNGNATACEMGDPINLNVGTPAGGQYSGPGVFNNQFYPDSVPGAGNYTLTYSYFSSVCGTASKDFNVNVFAAPAAPGVVIHNTYLECNVTASGYQWYDVNGPIAGATSKTFSPGVDGQYRVEISDNRGCGAFSAFTGYYIGLKDLPYGFDFKLYPNPASDALNLDLEAISDHEVQINIYDQVGNLIISRALRVSGALSEQLNISDLAAGVYLFTMEGEQVNIRQKVVIK